MTNDPKKNTSDPLDDFFTIEETPKPQSSQGGNPMDDFFSIDDQPITSQIPEMGVSALGKPKKVEDYNVMDHLVNGLVDFGRQLFNPIETEQSKENIGGRKNLARSTDKGFRTFAGSASRGLGEMFRFMTTAPGGMPMVVNPNNEEQLTEAYKKRINNEDLGGQLIGYADKQTEKASDIDTDPDHWTGVLGQVIPFTAGTVATVATSPLPPVSATIGAANLGTLGLSSFGSGIEAYDNYKDSKGLEKDYYERLGIGLLYGTAEFAMEKIQLDKFLPKGATSKMGKMVFGAVPEEQVAKKGADLVQDFIKSSPQRKSLVDNVTDIFKQSREGAMFEGGTEALTELSQEFTNWLYYEGEDKQINQEFFKQTMNAFVGGALMGGGLGPLSYGSQQVANKQRREKAGQVVIGHNKRTGETLEIVGQKSTGDGGVITYQAMRPNGKFTEVKEDEVENVVQLPYNSFKSILQGKEEGEVFLNQIEQQQLQDQINEQRATIETEMADKVYTDDLGNRVIAPAKYNGDEVFVVGKDPNNEKLGYIVNSKGERKSIELERLEDAEAIPYEEFVNSQLPAPPQPQGNRPPTVGESFELPEIPERETQAGRYTVTGIDREAGYIYAESVDEDGFIEEIPIDVFEQYRETGEEEQPQAASPANELLGDAQTLRNIFSEQDGKILSDNDKSEADQLPPGSTVNLQVDKPQEQASTRQIKLGKKDITIEETPEQRRVVTETPLTEKEAKSLAKQVSDRYPKVRFEVVDNTPQGDDFAEQDFQLVQKLNRPELNATYKLKGEEVEKAVIEQQLEQGNFDNIEIEGDNKLKNRLNTLKRTSEAPQAREVLNAPTLEQESKLTELIDTYNSGDQSVKNDIDFLADHLKYGLSSTRGGQLQLIDKKSGQVVRIDRRRKTEDGRVEQSKIRDQESQLKESKDEQISREAESSERRIKQEDETPLSMDESATDRDGDNVGRQTNPIGKTVVGEATSVRSNNGRQHQVAENNNDKKRTTGSEGGQTDNIDGTEGGIQSQSRKDSTTEGQPFNEVQEAEGVSSKASGEATQTGVEQVSDRARKFITLSKSSYEATGTNPFALIAGIGTRISELKKLFEEIEQGATTPRAKKVVDQINDYAERGYIDLQHSENVGRMYINERESIPFDTWLENGFVDAAPTQEQTTQIDAVLEQFTQENGELDAAAIRKQLTEDEGFFTIFPFSLNTEELNALKQQFNEEQGEKTGDSTEAGKGAEGQELSGREEDSKVNPKDFDFDSPIKDSVEFQVEDYIPIPDIKPVQSGDSTISKEINKRTWYHGSDSRIKADNIDTFSSLITGLVGTGFYLTDNPNIASGYAKSSARKSGGTPYVNSYNLNVSNVLNFNDPATEDVLKVFSQVFDFEFGKGYVRSLNEKSPTAYDLYQSIVEEVSYSGYTMYEASDFMSSAETIFRDLGYDALIHEGGVRKNSKTKHNVVVLFDPNAQVISGDKPKGVISDLSKIEQSKEGVSDSRGQGSKKVGQKEEGSQKSEVRSRKTEDGSQKMESEQDSSSSVSEKDSVTLAYGSEAKRKSAVRKTYQEILGKSVENPKDYQEGNGRSQTVREGRETSDINRSTPTIQEILRKVVPRTVLKTFKNSKRKDLTGVKINNSQDVADLFSIHRSPYIEKSQVIILDGDGKVLANFGRTDNLPNQTSTFPASTINSYKTVGAKKVFIMHNHPSGDHTVSRADIINTRAFAEQLDPDISFGGHVVIDTDKYSLIDSAGKVQELDYKEKPNALFSERAYIEDGNQAAELGAALLKREGMQQAVLYLDNKLGIAAFDVLPTDLTDKQIRDQISKAMDQNIGTNYILIHDGLRKSFMQAPEGIIDLIDIKQGETQKFTIKPRRKSVGQFFESTPEYKKQTETPAFKKWFGDSKVVDKNGEPLVVYHGSESSFNVFNKGGNSWKGKADQIPGMYFTDNRDGASFFALSDSTKYLRSFFLSIQNPLEVKNKNQIRELYNVQSLSEAYEEIRKNYDGLIIEEGLYAYGGPHKEIIAFNPTQIKSATGNRGAFDKNDPDIRHMKWPKSVQASKAEMQKAQKTVDSLSKNWKNAPKIELFENSERIKDKYPALQSVDLSSSAAIFWKDKVILNLAHSIHNEQGGTEKAVLHEVIGHYGLRNFIKEQAGQNFEQEFEKLLRSVVSQQWGTAEFESLANDYFDKTFSELTADEMLEIAEEWIAHKAQIGIKDTWIDRVVSLLRRALRKAGIDLKLSSSEIYNLIGNSYRYVMGADGNSARRAEIQPDFEFATVRHMKANPTPMTRYNVEDDAKTNKVRTLTNLSVNKEAWLKLQENLQDNMVRAKKLIEQKLGRTVKDSSNFYVKENLAKGRTLEQTESFKKDYFKPLLKLGRQMTAKFDVDVDQIGDYLYALHAPERNAYIKANNPKAPENPSGMSNTEAEKIKADFESKVTEPFRKELVRMVQTINQFVNDKRLATGLISQEVYDTLQDQYENYVPLRGFEGFIDEDTTLYSPLISAKGRESKAENPIPYLVTAAQEAIMKGEANMVKQSLFEFVKENPDKEVYQIRNAWYKKTGEKDENGEDIWEESAERPTKEQLENEEASRSFNPDIHKAVKMSNRGDNVISLQINGKKVYIEFKRPEIARALKGADQQKVPKLLKWLRSYTRWLSSMYTQYSPEFGVRNFIRDFGFGSFNAIAESGFKDWAYMAKEIPKSSMTLRKYFASDKYKDSKDGKMLKEFIESGGLTGYSVLQNASDIFNAAKAEINRLDAKNLWTKSKSLTKKGVEKLFSPIDVYNRTLENAVRFSYYKALRNSGATPQQAAIKSKDLTVNFNRKGNASSVMGSIYIFFNASVQGSERLLRNFADAKTRKKAVAMFGSLVAAGMAQSMIYALTGDEDDDKEQFYDKVPDYVKRTHIVLPNPFTDDTDDFIKVPLPYGLNVFYSMGEQLGSVIMGRQKPATAATGLLTAASDSFSPIGGFDFEGDELNVYQKISHFAAPSIASPILDLAYNRSFTGAPIRKEPFIEDGPQPPNSQQHFAGVNPIIKGVTDFLNEKTGGDEVMPGAIDINPEDIEHGMQSYFGGPMTFIDKASSTVSALLAGENIMKDPNYRNVPFVRNYLQKAGTEYDARQTFYERLDELEQINSYFKGYVDSSNKSSVQGYYNRNKNKLQLYEASKKYSKAIGKISKAIKAANESGIHNDKVDKLYQERVKLYKAFNKVYNEKTKPKQIESLDELFK